MTSSEKPPLFLESKQSRISSVPRNIQFIRAPYDQVYILQKKNAQGHFVQAARFSEPITQEQARNEFGNGYFILRSTKPRFATLWKGQIGAKQETQSNPSHPNPQITLEKLNRKTNLLTGGLIATAAGELIGFPLVHFRFEKLETQVAQLVAAIQHLPAQGIICSNCKVPVQYLLQPECTNCHSPLAWSTSPKVTPS